MEKPLLVSEGKYGAFGLVTDQMELRVAGLKDWTGFRQEHSNIVCLT